VKKADVTKWHFWSLVVFAVLVGVLGLFAYLSDGEPLYFGAMALVLILTLVAVLGAFAQRAQDQARERYFGVISTLLASVAGLAGGIGGGAAVGSEVGQGAAKQEARQVVEQAAPAAVKKEIQEQRTSRGR